VKFPRTILIIIFKIQWCNKEKSITQLLQVYNS
jgi:hypothetical protein